MSGSGINAGLCSHADIFATHHDVHLGHGPTCPTTSNNLPLTQENIEVLEVGSESSSNTSASIALPSSTNLLCTKLHRKPNTQSCHPQQLPWLMTIYQSCCHLQQDQTQQHMMGSPPFCTCTCFKWSWEERPRHHNTQHTTTVNNDNNDNDVNRDNHNNEVTIGDDATNLNTTTMHQIGWSQYLQQQLLMDPASNLPATMICLPTNDNDANCAKTSWQATKSPAPPDTSTAMSQPMLVAPILTLCNGCSATHQFYSAVIDQHFAKIDNLQTKSSRSIRLQNSCSMLLPNAPSPCPTQQWAPVSSCSHTSISSLPPHMIP